MLLGMAILYSVMEHDYCDVCEEELALYELYYHKESKQEVCLECHTKLEEDNGKVAV